MFYINMVMINLMIILMCNFMFKNSRIPWIFSMGFWFSMFIIFFSNLMYSESITSLYMKDYCFSDYISKSFCTLCAWSFTVCILASFQSTFFSNRWYLFNLNLMFFFLMMAFMSSDPVVFYIMFESVLIPVMIIMTYWGTGKGRFMAGLYMFVFTVVSSAPVLFFVVFLNIFSHFNNFFMISNFLFYMDFKINYFWFFCIFFCFMVKLPLFGFHFWLPKAHVESPTVGSMILAGVILKLGCYGMMRFYFVWDFMMKTSFWFWVIMMSIMMITSITCLFATFFQVDIKRMIAFSSVCHMSLFGFVVFIGSGVMINVMIFMVLTHGIISSYMFFVSGTFHMRFMKNRLLWVNSNMSGSDVTLCYIWMIGMLMYANSPGFGQFMTEVMCMTSMISISIWFFISMLILVLCTTIYAYSFYISISSGFFKSYGSNSFNVSVCEMSVVWFHVVFCIFFMFFFAW